MLHELVVLLPHERSNARTRNVRCICRLLSDVFRINHKASPDRHNLAFGKHTLIARMWRSLAKLRVLVQHQAVSLVTNTRPAGLHGNPCSGT
jgi:hypothetical protein